MYSLMLLMYFPPPSENDFITSEETKIQWKKSHLTERSFLQKGYFIPQSVVSGNT